jgi:hypothetical protein
LQGYGPGGTITLTQSTAITTGFAQGQMHRSQCEILLSAGPNGHFTGGGASIKITDNSNAFTPPGTPSLGSTYTIWTAIQAGTSVAFTDQSLATGAPGVVSKTVYNAGTPGASINVLQLPELSPSAQFGGTTSLTQTTVLSIGPGVSDPVSETIRIRRCWTGVVTQ